MIVEMARLTADEKEQVGRIIERVRKLAKSGNPVYTCNMGDLEMDLRAVHAHTPIDFAALEMMDAFEFAHDISGIDAHIDRLTGALRNCFVPRCAVREVWPSLPTSRLPHGAQASS